MKHQSEQRNSKMNFKKLSALALSVLIFSSMACETGVDPFIDEDRFFTLFGSLDTKHELQFIRVIPVSRNFDRDDSVIDAKVVSTDLTNGDVHVWRDSVVTYSDGTIGHLFVSDFRVRPGHTYRIDVSDSQGNTSTATTTMPSFIEGEIGEASLSQ